MSFHGMDIEAALRHARSLEIEGANEVFDVITRMTGLMPHLVQVWHGTDAQHFQAEWEQHAGNLRTLHAALTDLVGSLNESIRVQQNTSQA